MRGYSSIIPHSGKWILAEPSSDTVFSYSLDHTMIPFIVRTPSIESMDPEVFLLPYMLTERYYFVQSMTKERNGFSTKDLMYDRQTQAIFEYTVYNDDISNHLNICYL